MMRPSDDDRSHDLYSTHSPAASLTPFASRGSEHARTQATEIGAGCGAVVDGSGEKEEREENPTKEKNKFDRSTPAGPLEALAANAENDHR